MSQNLLYRDYTGSVLFSSEDKLLYGRVLGIRDTLTYEGKDVRSLERNFRAAVDEYIAFCAAEGKAPDVPFKGSFNVRVSSDLHKRAAIYAEEHDLKLNAVVQEALQAFLSHVD